MVVPYRWWRWWLGEAEFDAQMITPPTSKEAPYGELRECHLSAGDTFVGWPIDGRRIPMVALDGGCGGTALFRRKSHGDVLCVRCIYFVLFFVRCATSKIPLVSLML